MTFNAILYGEKLPLSGAAATAFFTDDTLVINLHGMPELRVPTQQLTANVGGFEHDALFLNWSNTLTNVNGELTQQQYSLKSASEQDAKQIYATAPAHLLDGVNAWRSRNRSLKLMWRSIGSVCAAALLSVLLLWWQYDHVMDFVVAKIPISTEESFSKAALQGIKAEGNEIESGAAVDAVKNIGGRLTVGSKYKYQWLVIKSNEVNAYAMPGGVVVVNSALIEKADNADELAAVLAHEVQHVEKRHSLKNMVTTAGWAAALAIVAGDVSAISAVILHKAGTLYYGRDLEAQADKLGLAALIKAKIKPDGFVSFFKKLKKEQGEELPTWISDHPATDDRIKMLEAAIKANPCAACASLNINWKAAQLSVKNAKEATEKNAKDDQSTR